MPADFIAEIETDRYCDECGFNLRTQPVFRDDATRLLIVRCTECGRMHPAQQLTSAPHLWLRRLATLLIAVWIIALLGATFGLGAIETAMHFVTLDELTEGSRSGTRTVTADYEGYRSFMTLVLGVSCACGFLMITLLVCACHHWRRWIYFIPAVVIPLVPAGIAHQAWSYEAPTLMDWGRQYMLMHAGAAIAGGTVGAALGRKFARGMVSVLLPPRSRSMLAFLWLADGKQAPKTLRGR